MRFNSRYRMVLCGVLAIMLIGCGNAGNIGAESHIQGNIEATDVLYIEDAVSDEESGLAAVSEVEEENEAIDLNTVEGNDAFIIDDIGYRPVSRKYVYIYGENLDKKYEIINIENGRTVFANELKIVAGKETDGTKLYVGDFTDYVSKGTFRIHHEELGYSKAFRIYPDRIRDEYKEIYNQIKACEVENKADLLYVLSNLLLIKDVYPDAYADSDYINAKIDELIGLQDELAEEAEPGDEEITMAAQYAGVLAQYSVIYEEENAELAQKARMAAQRTFTYAERNRDKVAGDIYYFSSAQLYRATGQYMYRSAIEWFDSLGSEKTDYSRYGYVFLADVAYLKTNKRTDYERCQSLMKNYLLQAGKISQDIDKSTFYVEKNISRLSELQILGNMQKLALVSYVVSGHEYTTILENYVHYMNGVNDKSDVDTDAKMQENAVILSKKLFSLAHLYNM
ncbi:MAG: glycoside hydrolase family 9 protein [Lachnospiraceae bacterium]|nr:glycoside hydrolase family 9 protein [Candidatus Colinaster scatohippi]